MKGNLESELKERNRVGVIKKRKQCGRREKEIFENETIVKVTWQV